MPYTLALTELRQMLDDSPFNKKVSKKKLIGNIDGSNVRFISYDKRLYSDTLQVFVGEESVGFTLVDDVGGEIDLTEPPSGNVKVTASYYWQWWTDSELKNFLNKGAEMVGQSVTTTIDNAYLNIPSGLKTGSLLIASSLAARALISFIVLRKHSSEFLLEQDGNSDSNYDATLKTLQLLADMNWKNGIEQRDDFYKRQGRRNSPAFGIKIGQNRRYGPNK
ncbi:MAG: hypothetical protein IPQ08_06190 [Chitinophagaceae bacterium]|nr:hypothetical protein [Chitinophagaceae bacterium]